MSSAFEIVENALYNVHNLRVLGVFFGWVFVVLGYFSLFIYFSKDTCFHITAARERLTKSVVFAATLISSESLKLDMVKLFNLP